MVYADAEPLEINTNKKNLIDYLQGFYAVATLQKM